MHFAEQAINFRTGQYDRQAPVSFGSDRIANIFDIFVQDMPEQEQNRIEGLVLSGCLNLLLHCQMRHEVFYIDAF